MTERNRLGVGRENAAVMLIAVAVAVVVVVAGGTSGDVVKDVVDVRAMTPGRERSLAISLAAPLMLAAGQRLFDATHQRGRCHR